MSLIGVYRPCTSIWMMRQKSCNESVDRCLVVKRYILEVIHKNRGSERVVHYHAMHYVHM